MMSDWTNQKGSWPLQPISNDVINQRYSTFYALPNVWLWTLCIASIWLIISPGVKANFAQGIVPPKCLQCLCDIESSCRPNPCISGSGLTSCGYFGISEDYYNACGRPGNGWKECAADKFCSSLCVQNYITAQMHNCAEKNCLSFARLHHGGPRGCYNPHTMTHALWVQKCAAQNI